MHLPTFATASLFVAVSVSISVALPPAACCNNPEIVDGHFRLQWEAPDKVGVAVLERSIDLRLWSEVRAAAFSPKESVTFGDSASPGLSGHYRVRWTTAAAPDFDSDGIDDFEELAVWPSQHPLNPATSIDETDGSVALASDAHFQQLAYKDITNPELDLREVKFLVAGIDTEHPKLWFMNTAIHRSHSLFAQGVLGIHDFLEFGYAGSSPRKYFAGTLVFRPNYVDSDGSTGVYLIESLPNDPIDFAFMGRISDLVSLAAPDLGAPLAYHPAGDIQRALWKEDADTFARSFVRVVSDEMLYASQPYQALNTGIAFGWLRLASGSAIDHLGPGDITIFRSIPNEIGRLAGVITESPQTPLSHVNLRARQDGVPNAYLRDASNIDAIFSLIDKPVRLEVKPSGLVVTEASASDVTTWLDTLGPSETTILKGDLVTNRVRSLDALGQTDFVAYGAKAANLGELGKIIPEHAMTKGFAIPFAWFHEAMRESGLDQWIAGQLADTRMTERDWRNATLKEIRRRVKRVEVPRARIDELEHWRSQFPAGQPLRCRSSANSEDLISFNGAGLYESYTHRPDEGELVNSIRQVWASMWTARAYEEREFYRIDHLSAKMGVLVHPNFDDELANGVAVATNLFTAGAPGYTINAQFGEELVTNPEADAVPEEWLTTPSGEGFWQALRMRSSSLATPDRHTVMTLEETTTVAGILQTVTAHFKSATGAVSPRFAMEIEFKITLDGNLVVKQARPWVR